MRENIYKMSKKLLGNPEFCEKLATKETFDDTYKFCKSIQDGYTKEEFENFLDESVYEIEEIFEGMVNKFPEEKQEAFVRDFAKEFCGISETDFDILIGKLTPKQLSQVAGGKNSRVYNKIVASSLAALTFASPIQPAFASKDIASPKEISGNNKNQDKQENENKQKPGLFKRIWGKTKNFVWNNKGKITVGLGVLAVIGVAAAYELNSTFQNEVNEKVINPVANFFGKSKNKSEVKTSYTIKKNKDDKPIVKYTIHKGNKCYKLAGEFDTKDEANQKINEVNKKIKEINEKSGNIEEYVSDTKDWDIEVDNNYESSSEKSAEKLYSDTKNKLFDIIGLGPLFLAANMGICMLKDAKDIAKNVESLWNFRWTLDSIAKRTKKWYEEKLHELNAIELTVEESLQNLNELFSIVKGQAKAKETIKAQVNTILRDRDFYKRRGQQYKKCNIFYFIGPSGVGKSMIAKGLADFNVLSSSTPYYMSASSIDKKSNESYIEQLFGVNRSYYSYGNENSRGEATSLVQYIKSNPNGVVVIDEYDKMWCEGLDEIFRTAMDKGEIEVRQQKIDCSNITFILTSNESMEAIQGDKPIEVEMDDGTTNLVSHDRSFINRVTRVQFENLSVEDNMEIIQQEFEESALSYWRSEEIAGIDIILDDDCLRKMAIAVIETKRGARYIEELRKNLMRDVTKKIYDTSTDSTSGVSTYKGKKLFACFNDYDTNERKHSFRLFTEAERNALVKKHVEVMKKYFELSALSYWKENAGVDIVLDDECLRKMALSIIATGNSKKYIEIVNENLMRDVAEKIYGTSGQNGTNVDSKYKGQKLLAYFNDYGTDEKKHGFKLLSEDEKDALDKKKKTEVPIDSFDIELIEEQEAKTDDEKDSEFAKEQEAETANEKDPKPTEEQEAETAYEKDSEPAKEQEAETSDEKDSEPAKGQKAETANENDSSSDEEQKAEDSGEKVNPINIKPSLPENKDKR